MQRKVVGSERKLFKFNDNSSVLKSGKHEVVELGSVGYNGGMKTFNKDILTPTEKKSIIVWTEDSTKIKQSMWGLISDKTAESHANTLFGLFDTYKTNVKLNKKLYRGMSIPDDLFIGMGYDLLEKGSDYTPDNLAITSFSASNRIAYEFAKDGEYTNKVLLKVEAHGSDIIDITDISTVAKEEETILMKNVWYNVRHIKRVKDGGVKWLIIILQKK